MPDPFKKFASVLETRLSGMAAKAASGLPSELGTFTGSGLKLDSFPHEIPEFLVADWSAKLHFPAFSLIGMMTSPVDEEGNPQGGAVPGPRARFDFEEAEIEDVQLDWRSGLKAGDRVLAVPVNGGQEAVVLCKVVGSGG
ncbi:hypothetical protein [Cohnella caldifontis]|uniref:hypothetical protein n=1 Tax=Cohnella caldifontis TaxID=3027471 RepID=UPI0023EC3E66|nr:hypothetical protein [Cohnella sp. YIM B05605]